MQTSNVRQVTRRFTDFEVTSRTGSRRKQRLSNSVTINFGNGPVESTLRLTSRQAEALRRFLNETLSE